MQVYVLKLYKQNEQAVIATCRGSMEYEEREMHGDDCDGEAVAVADGKKEEEEQQQKKKRVGRREGWTEGRREGDAKVRGHEGVRGVEGYGKTGQEE